MLNTSKSDYIYFVNLIMDADYGKQLKWTTKKTERQYIGIKLHCHLSSDSQAENFFKRHQNHLE